MRKILHFSFVLLLFLTISHTGYSQEIVQKKKFSLTEAQDFALLNSYSAINQEYELKIAKKKVMETIADGLPQINFSGNYSKNLDLPFQMVPAQAFGVAGAGPDDKVKIQFGSEFNSDATISVNQKIFDGAYIIGTMAARVFVDLTRNQKEKTAIDIKELVAQSYYNVLIAYKNFKTLEENLAVNQRQFEETKAYFKNGLREELDLDQIELMLSNTKSALADAKRSIHISKTVLKFVMGYDIDNEINLSEDLDSLISKEDSNSLDGFNPNMHIDYRMIETNIHAQKLLIKSNQAKYLPVISAFYNYGRGTATDESNVFKRSVPWYTNSVIGVKINLPIFTGFRNKSIIKQNKFKYESLISDKKSVEQNLKKELSISFSNLQTAKEKFENDKKGYDIAKRIYDKTRIKFNEGMSTSNELSENEKQYLNSHSNYLQSTLNLLNSEIAYKKALGIL
ncbi:MAG: TolC family protein [Marinifilaceae bacterium]|jgi:outer membrane protein TolC|nr:TolC family protein [Marinifilaceae bacterium]